MPATEEKRPVLTLVQAVDQATGILILKYP